MKERFLAGLKKASVIIIASIMLLGVIPLGMISHVATVNAEGEFLRLQPETEVSVAAESTLQGDGKVRETKDIHEIGERHFGYLRFDIRSLLEREPEEIKSAKLRLVLLRTPAKEPVPVQLWLMQETGWNRSMKWDEKPSRLGEVPVASMTVSPDTDGKSRLFEVDLTEYLRKWMEEGREKVSFRLDSLGSGIAAVYGGSSHEDPLFRPCLKVVTGTAEDPDGNTLQKVRLSQQYATEQEETVMMTVGDGKEVYLKFSFNTENIRGTLYQAMLRLGYLQGDEGAMLRIDRLENTDWTAEEMKEGKPYQGERYPLYREEDFEAGNYDEIDMTDAVNDSLAKGKTELALLLWCENGSMVFESQGEMAPRLMVSVSDDRTVAAMMEASASALGKNKSPSEVTKALADDGIANNGIRTEISWQAIDRKTGLSARSSLSENGKIYRPQWFRESKEILATATISAGEVTRERKCYLTILPKEAPEFKNTEFSPMLDVGFADAEEKNKFESVGTVAKSRWVAGRKMTYREMKQDEMMILHFPVDSEKRNYLTVKLWEEDEFPGLVVSCLQNRELSPFAIAGTDMAEKEEGGFLYLTYPIPLSYTKGRDYVSLALTMAEKTQEENEETTESLEEGPVASVYDVYVAPTPWFDPLSFAEQGEVVVKKTEEEESALYRFLQKIYGAAEETFDFRDAKNQEEALPQTEEKGVYTDIENQKQAVLVLGGEERLMLALPDTGTLAQIYRDTPYYNAYSQTTVQEYQNGAMQAVDYGVYRIFRNRGRREAVIPWEQEEMSGLYQELAGGGHYSFLKKGEMTDDSILPEGTAVEDGRKLTVLPGETLALMRIAEPLYYPDFRVSEINGRAVAELTLKDPLIITSLTLRAMGTVPKQEEKLMILCGIYDRGMLVGLEQKLLTVSGGQVAAELLLEEPLYLQPGQTLKVFAEDQIIRSKPMTPILELPQKQQVMEQKAS